MILYNVTVAVDPSVHEEWYYWMTREHIPEVMATGKFTDWKIYRVLLEKEGQITYSIQYFAENMGQLQLYQAQHANTLQQKHRLKFGDKAVAFRTVLEEA